MDNDTYVDIYGRRHTINKELSRGGQGAVFLTEEPGLLLKLELDPNTNEFVKDSSNNAKYDNLRILPISPKTHITLPQTVLAEYSGYTMKLLDGMRSFYDVFDIDEEEGAAPKSDWLKTQIDGNPDLGNLLNGYARTGGTRKRLEAYLKAAAALAKIHTGGLVYCDVSDKNMFVSANPEDAHVWLIDCDNLVFMNKVTKGCSWRTPDYGAPEIFSGCPNTAYSDAFSFAIAMFKTLADCHPFVGEMTDEKIEEFDFLPDGHSEGDMGIKEGCPWIGDSEDDSNSAENESWRYFLSDKLHSMFDAAFSEEARKSRRGRVTLPEWAHAIAGELDRVVRCQTCGMDYYYGHEQEKCFWCREANPVLIVEVKGPSGATRKFIHEIDGQAVKIPLRTLKGFSCDGIDDALFTVSYTKNGIEIANADERYSYFILMDEREKRVYGAVNIKGASEILMSVRDDPHDIKYQVKIVAKV